jgi:hypothetical protein
MRRYVYQAATLSVFMLTAACKKPATETGPAPGSAPTSPTTPAVVAQGEPSSQPVWNGPASQATISSTALPLPGVTGSTNFDDFQFDAASGKLLIPAGQSGKLEIVDPATRAVTTTISGFSTDPAPNGRHGGTTSASAGAGYWFASDRSTHTVNIVDPKKGAIVATAKLAGGPDYVRYVAPTGEVWVTEPHDGGLIEVFKLTTGDPPSLTSTGTFPVPDAPESLVIDATRGRAYTNDEPKQKTEAIDLKTHAIVATWPNACKGEASGMVLDEARGLIVIGCGEGAAAVLDIAHDGAQRGYFRIVTHTDIIGYDPTLGHVYLPGAQSATMAILGLSSAGDLSLLGIASAAQGSKCVVMDDRHTAWICDPAHGQLLYVPDTFAATK